MVTGWIEKPLGELFNFSGGVSASRAQLSNIGYPYLHYGGIHGTTQTFVDVCTDNTIPRLNVSLNKISNASLLQDGDVVFVDASEDDEGASRHIVVKNAENRPFISGLHTIVAKPKTDELDSRYREHCFQTVSIKSQFKFYAVGTKVVGVNKSTIKDINLCFPVDIKEQQRIAAALSDTDAYITALEKLTAKKRAIKQGAMQELLTGKRRLPGFSGDWVEKPFNEIAEKIIMGQSPDSRFYNNSMKGLPLVQGNADVENRRTIKRFYTSVITRLGEKGDIIMTVRAPVGNVAKADFNCCLGRGVCAIKGSDYLYHLLVFSEPKWSGISTGSTFDSISGNELREVMFIVPVDEKEQTAIAAILSDMDVEIDALTAKLEKMRNIKQGMMSELLTGRIRLVEAEQETAQPAKIIEIPKPAPAQKSGHNQQFDDAVMIAGIVDAFYSDKFRLGRKKVQKLLYLLRRYQDESTAVFKKKAAGPYADVVRYKGGEPIARSNGYIATTTVKGKGTTFAKGKNIQQALDYISRWNKQADIQWLLDKFLYKSGDDLELLATVDMAICDLAEAGIAVSVESIKHLIATNKEWRDKLNKQVFEDRKIAQAIRDLEELL
jgi:type I restriction enzyme S subunit